jgi:membrane fusion protein (multidrug efflux system)
VVNADNTVAQQTITTGEMINGKWLVTSGLKAGDRVIVDGLQNVRSGAKVNASESQDKAAPQANLSTTDPSAQ